MKMAGNIFYPLTLVKISKISSRNINFYSKHSFTSFISADREIHFEKKKENARYIKFTGYNTYVYFIR